MIRYEIGDMFRSNADCLINTVNCEGYMGKGIAYQFKMKFPENNKDYISACKTGKLHIGSLHFYKEEGKTIINFPTKDKWRENSKISYIEVGLKELVRLLPELSVSVIAIPPLGCGNGGLIWQEVKPLIEKIINPIQEEYDFLIFEPSRNYVQKAKKTPKLSLSSLVLMRITMQLKKFNMIRLQKTAYFMDIFLKEKYFKFEKYKFGPYSYSIELVSKNIREFQYYFDLQNINETYEMVYQKLCSEKIDAKLGKMLPAINQASDFVNNILNDRDLEGVATALFLIESSNEGLNEEDVVQQFQKWSNDKAKRFSGKDIISYVYLLEEKGIIEKDIFGDYHLSN